MLLLMLLIPLLLISSLKVNDKFELSFFFAHVVSHGNKTFIVSLSASFFDTFHFSVIMDDLDSYPPVPLHTPSSYSSYVHQPPERPLGVSRSSSPHPPPLTDEKNESKTALLPLTFSPSFTSSTFVNLPSWTRNFVDPDDFSMMVVSPDGHCFFSSVRNILLSVDCDCSIMNIRHAVARGMLDDSNSVVNDTIQNWLTLYKEAIKEKNGSLIEEFKHMEGLELAKWPLTTEERQRLYVNMMTKLYYGEQHATRVVEEKLQVRFLIFNGDLKRPQINFGHGKSYAPTHYCFLYLSHIHYNPVLYKNKFVWKWEELSYQVQSFFHQACNRK